MEMAFFANYLASGVASDGTFWGEVAAYGQIIVADLVLSGDNALIIGMAAASLAPDLRKKAIFYGMVIAAVLRIIFAIIATKLLGIPGLLFAGSVLLFWVCWRLYQDIRANAQSQHMHDMALAEEEDVQTKSSKKSFRAALISILIADVSMSLDNVLAVAAIADGDAQKLFIGLALAILLMAFAATLIMRLLARFPIISWIGLAVLLYVAADMFYRGLFDPETGVLPLLGLASGGIG